MKCAVTISLDEDLVKELRSKGINISGTINSYLRNYLKPKKANVEEEQKKVEVMEFGKQFNMSKEFSIYTYDTIDLDATGIWQHIKDNYEPNFSIYDFIEIRNKFRERFCKSNKKLNNEDKQ